MRVVIADDEAPARKRLTSLLRNQSGFEVSAVCASGGSALATLGDLRPDIAFLDVQMPGLSGIEVVRRLSATAAPVVVFVTAFDQYAISAFELHALDYLLKPYTDERFAGALGHAASIVRGRRIMTIEPKLRALLATWPAEQSAAEAMTPERARLTIRAGTKLHVILADAVGWIAAERDYVVLHTTGGPIRSRGTLRSVLRHMQAEPILSVSRSIAVHLSHVVELATASDGSEAIVLRDGTRIAISRRFRARVRRQLRIKADVHR